MEEFWEGDNLYSSDMKEVFVKRYWADDDITFYLHFQNGKAIAQVEMTPKGKIYLSTDSPLVGDSMLYDQSLDELDLGENDFITKEDFMKIWDEK
jgi:hypothetical protein